MVDERMIREQNPHWDEEDAGRAEALDAMRIDALNQLSAVYGVFERAGMTHEQLSALVNEMYRAADENRKKLIDNVPEENSEHDVELYQYSRFQERHTRMYLCGNLFDDGLRGRETYQFLRHYFNMEDTTTEDGDAGSGWAYMFRITYRDRDGEIVYHHDVHSPRILHGTPLPEIYGSTPGEPATLGQRIRHLRAEKGITQQGLASMLNTHQTHVSKWEKDEIRPNTRSAQRLADALDVPLDFIFG